MSIFKHLLLPACALALLAGCAANPGASSDVAQQNQAPAAADQVATSKDDSQDVSCDTEMETGSHVHRHTVCMTQQDRDAQERAMSSLGAHGTGPASH